MSAAFEALVEQGDFWLKQASQTYQGGGGVQSAGAEAAIAQAYFLRAAIEKPDTLALLVRQQQMRAQMEAAMQNGAAAGGDEHEAVRTDDLSG